MLKMIEINNTTIAGNIEPGWILCLFSQHLPHGLFRLDSCNTCRNLVFSDL